jgi:methylmalonyl-CoA mutase
LVKFAFLTSLETDQALSTRPVSNTHVNPYKPTNKVRIVTAASLFDGHDAAINIMRRIIQATGCEVIHLGHDRSVEEVVNTAIQEDAQAIAMTSYQGGHTEYFKYMLDLLKERGASNIKIFAGGGGVILPEARLRFEWLRFTTCRST